MSIKVRSTWMVAGGTLHAVALTAFWMAAAFEMEDLSFFPIALAAVGSMAAFAVGLSLTLIHVHAADARLRWSAVAALIVTAIGPANALVDGMAPVWPGLALATSVPMLAMAGWPQEQP